MHTPLPADVSFNSSHSDIGLAADFSRLVVGPYRKGIERMLARQMGFGDDLEDAVQEALASVFRTYPTIRDPKCLPAWIVQVATRVGAKQIHRRQRRAALAPSPYTPASPGRADGPTRHPRNTSRSAACERVLKAT